MERQLKDLREIMDQRFVEQKGEIDRRFTEQKADMGSHFSEQLRSNHGSDGHI
ncbi:MAG: hypothetical protein N3E49_08860 [Bacteroidia bacterium]|nr:hypothetical protein [Bacteroidia bacterium]